MAYSQLLYFGKWLYFGKREKLDILAIFYDYPHFLIKSDIITQRKVYVTWQDFRKEYTG